MKIKYDADEKGKIVFPDGPPFDGKPILIKLGAGWCEAWWGMGRQYETPYDTEYEGWYWVCLDDKFIAEIDDAREWLPLPEPSE